MSSSRKIKPKNIPSRTSKGEEINHVNLPIRIAVLIDGGFFIKRFNHNWNKNREMTPDEVANHLYTLAHSHVGKENYLYRIFYYDCLPLVKRVHNPVSTKCIVFENNPEAVFRRQIIECLKHKRKVALRLGSLKDSGKWYIKASKTKELISGKIGVADLQEEDVFYEMKQKGIDMKIGVDIASLSLKRFVDKIVLFSGDSDFVPAAKLARREGIDFVLDPMGAHVEPSLFEHIDGLKSSK
ncbi:MAG: NYN domain-containing protein [Fermentimonas sp.]|nr:NYN domain-containing protein [Fermentimonas sp.]